MFHRFDPYTRDYRSLSVSDLLEARDAYHVHLAHKQNVFATAIGLFRIRVDDPDAGDYRKTHEAAGRRGKLGARRFDNTVIRPWSWPCVLVFVEKWIEGKVKDKDVVPPFLYLPDGRVIPVCVIEAPLDEAPQGSLADVGFSSQMIGGGYPVLAVVQGREHVGSLGCIVSNGDRYFALTNQHVAGPVGQEIYTVVNGVRQRIGASAGRSLGELPFETAYPGLISKNTQSNLDIGLIEMDDMAQWTAQVFGLGELGPLVDFHSNTATLDWITMPVLAHGGASGQLRGEIQALFYRYRTVGGTDYVSDFLIGGRKGEALATRPGDSGTVWCIDPEILVPPSKAHGARKNGRGVPPATEYRPFAVEWGGQRLLSGVSGKYAQFALAASVAVACRELDVEIVPDWNTGHTQYWGAVGHYKIAQMASAGVRSQSLNTFLEVDNLGSLSYAPDNISASQISRDASKFVPLADVPDIVWKTNVNRGGKAARAQENWLHYADMDMPGAGGQTLLDLCGQNPVKLDLQQWITLYQQAPPVAGKKVNQGSLPFRVWQIFDAMTKYRAQGNAGKENFLCAAGILAHYVGDSCQPLHSSMHSDGLNGTTTGVHSTYEEKMIDAFAPELRTKLDGFRPLPPLPLVKSGYEAGAMIVDLVRRTHANLPPEHICDVYNKLGGGQKQATITGLWNELGDATVACIADGIRVLATLWESAYARGSGDYSGQVSPGRLKAIYEAATFLPSLHIANLNPADYKMNGPVSGAQPGAPPKNPPQAAAARGKGASAAKPKKPARVKVMRRANGRKAKKAA